MSSLGWKGRCDSPARLLRGSGTVPVFILGWFGVEVGRRVSHLGLEGVGIVQDDCRGGPGRYSDYT